MYKAVIMDLDGTAIPNKRDGMPSERIINIIQKIKNKVFVSAATGRGMSLAGHIIKELGLTAPCIVNGGTRIIDPVTKKILWEKSITKSQVKKIMEIAKEYQYDVFIGDDTEGSLAKYKITNRDERIIYIEPVTKEDTEIMLNKLSKISDVIAHKVISWTPGYFDIHVTHKEATKRHSMEILLDILKVHKDEVVAIGDSNNDLPLFELAGYKIAMANGSDELKREADMIASSVSEDGLAVVLEKLFL
jgi:Cof subfamily protein (haloacid dehalogenase superfamily)